MVKLLDLQKITMAHGDEYKAAVNRVIESGWFLQGKENQQFEADYARYIGSEHCVAVANGLDALKLILRGYMELGIFHEGDEIIVPANTYIATILSITDNHLTPVLVEPTWEHLEIDIDRIEEAITPKTKGIMTVHLYGRIAYNDKLKALCEKYHLKLMEDCAQSHGCGFNGHCSTFNVAFSDTAHARHSNASTALLSLNRGVQCSTFKKTGALGDAAAHSFYPGKNMGAFGDAGAVTTNDTELATVIRALANYGSQKKYVFKYQGINSRMSEVDAAVLGVKLKYLDEDNKKRQQLAAYYYAHISNPLITLPKRRADEENVDHQFPMFCERRDELQAFLAEHGVQTLIHYPIPPHQQECYREWNNRSYPIAEKIHKQELSIPMNQVITEEEAQEVVRWVNAFK